jgi:hypothetical protein
MGLVDDSDAFSLPLDPTAWTDRICAVVGRTLNDGERKLTPDRSRTDVCG